MTLLLKQVEHGPAQVFRTPFRDAVEAPGADLVSIATVEAPWGTERWSNRPFSPDGLGNFKPRIIGTTETGPSVSPRTYTLSALEASIVLDDNDQALHKLIQSYEQRLRGSTVTLQTAVRGLAAAHWYTYFTGELDSWELVPAGYRLTFRTKDLPLRSDFPRREITSGDRPNAPADSIGRFYQVVYGVHDSSAVGAKGLVPGIEVDTVGFVYHFSLGRLSAFKNVYADGAIIPTSDYAVQYPLTNGFRETVVDFVTSKAGKVITADVDGLTDRGAGGGRILNRPMEIVQHLLVNFVYGDWRDGAWLDSATAPLDLPTWWLSDEWLARKGWKATLIVGGDRETTDGLDIIEAAGRTFHVHPHWNELGKLAVGPIDAFLYELLIARPWVRGRYHDLDSAFALPQNTRQIVDRVAARWLPSAAEGKLLQTVEVEDLAVEEDAKVTFDLDYSEASA